MPFVEPEHEVRMGNSTKAQLSAGSHRRRNSVERPGCKVGELARAPGKGARAVRAKLIQSKSWAPGERFSKPD